MTSIERAKRADPQDLAAAVTALRDRLRRGELEPERVRAAARLGHPVARIIHPEFGVSEDGTGDELLSFPELVSLHCDCAARTIPILDDFGVEGEGLKADLQEVRDVACGRRGVETLVVEGLAFQKLELAQPSIDFWAVDPDHPAASGRCAAQALDFCRALVLRGAPWKSQFEAGVPVSLNSPQWAAIAIADRSIQGELRLDPPDALWQEAHDREVEWQRQRLAVYLLKEVPL